jgi:hypothetical protein
MTHALYFVVPNGRSRLINGIAGSLWEDPMIGRIGCVVESRSDRQFLRVDSYFTYERIKFA